MSLRPLVSKNSHTQNLGQINDMMRQINKEQVVKTFKGSNGDPAVIIGRIDDDTYGIRLTDGTVTTTIVASGITQNDGTNDRIFMGNE